MVKRIGEERRVRMGLETRERVGCWDRGMRPRQFNATSSGRDGIRLLGLSDSSERHAHDIIFPEQLPSGSGCMAML